MKKILLLLSLALFLNSKMLLAQYKKPQEPTDFSSYSVEEVAFTNTNANNITLSGTLTLPKNIKNLL